MPGRRDWTAGGRVFGGNAIERENRRARFADWLPHEPAKQSSAEQIATRDGMQMAGRAAAS